MDGWTDERTNEQEGVWVLPFHLTTDHMRRYESSKPTLCRVSVPCPSGDGAATRREPFTEKRSISALWLPVIGICRSFPTYARGSSFPGPLFCLLMLLPSPWRGIAALPWFCALCVRCCGRVGRGIGCGMSPDRSVVRVRQQRGAVGSHAWLVGHG